MTINNHTKNEAKKQAKLKNKGKGKQKAKEKAKSNLEEWMEVVGLSGMEFLSEVPEEDLFELDGQEY